MTGNLDKRAPIDRGKVASPRSSIGYRLGHGHGHGHGAHPSEGPHPYRSSSHMVYGTEILNRYEWLYTAYLVEFLMTTNWQDKITVEPPPKDDSDQTKAELVRMLDKQKHDEREERRDEIVAEDEDYLGVFENLCFFDTHSHPAISDLVQTVDLIGWNVVQYYKELYGRLRPSYVDPTLHPMLRVAAHASYPSGHSTQAHLIDNALSEVFRDRSERFLGELHQAATRIGENREWAGVHYESDTLAGKNLAAAVWALIQRNANFKKLIEAARAEAQRVPYKRLDHPAKK